MASVHWQFEGIQASKLGQFKICLKKKKLVFGSPRFSQPSFLSQTLQRREKLRSIWKEKEKKAYFVLIVRPFNFLEASFLSNNMNTFKSEKVYLHFSS